MAINEENVSKILSVLSHPLRRRILLYLSENTESAFTDLATAHSVDTGKLSFHLRSLEAFIEQTPAGKYRLSPAGQNAIVLIRDLESWALQDQTATRSFIHPLATWKKRTAAYLIDFTIAFSLFVGLPNVLYILTSIEFLINANIAAFLVLFWIYSTLLEGFSGQTLGKIIMHIKVVRVDGTPVSYDEAAVRNFGKVFFLPIDVLIGWRMRDEKHIRYFDKFAGTTVLDFKPPLARPAPTSAPATQENSQKGT
jgi:uncharacterized RDD family membrane protein YckC/DNA-binding HxlR family transcriptional regulator